MKAAIYLKNGVICKTNNIQKKLKREKEPIDILEEWEYNSDNQKLDEKYNYWCRTINYKTPEIEEENPLKYHWRNKITGHTHHSIYPHMANIPNINPEEWEPYEED